MDRWWKLIQYFVRICLQSSIKTIFSPDSWLPLDTVLAEAHSLDICWLELTFWSDQRKLPPAAKKKKALCYRDESSEGRTVNASTAEFESVRKPSRRSSTRRPMACSLPVGRSRSTLPVRHCKIDSTRTRIHHWGSEGVWILTLTSSHSLNLTPTGLHSLTEDVNMYKHLRTKQKEGL